MKHSLWAATCLIAAATSALAACDKKSPMRDAASANGRIERMRSDERKASDAVAAPAVSNSERATAVAAEPATTMTLSFPLEQPSAPPAKASERAD